MIALIIQMISGGSVVVPTPPSSLQVANVPLQSQTTDSLFSADLFSVIGRIDLMINLITLASTVLFFIIGYLVWTNKQAKDKFDKEVQAISDIRKKLEGFHSSILSMFKKFSVILDAYDKSLAKAARSIKLLKEAAGEIEESAKKAKAPVPLVQNVVAAQKALSNSFKELQTFAGTATAIRESMRPTIEEFNKYYSDFATNLTLPYKEFQKTIESTNKLFEYWPSSTRQKKKKNDEK